EESKGSVALIKAFEENKGGRGSFKLNYSIREVDEEIHTFINSMEQRFVNQINNLILNRPDAPTAVKISFDHVDLSNLPDNIEIQFLEDHLLVHLFSVQNKGGHIFPIPFYVLDKNSDFEQIYNALCNRISKILTQLYFQQMFGYKDLLFFPSERNTYVTDIYNSSADLFQENYTFESETNIRISQALFNERYLRYKDYLNIYGNELSNYNDELYNLLCKFIGGIPKFKDGEITD